MLKATEPPLGVTEPVTSLKMESLIAAVVSLVQPVGAEVCWKPSLVPEANGGVGVVLVHVVPLLVNTFPDVLGATALTTPEVPINAPVNEVARVVAQVTPKVLATVSVPDSFKLVKELPLTNWKRVPSYITSTI